MPAHYPPYGDDPLDSFEDEDPLLTRLPQRREMHLTDAIFVIRKRLWLLITFVACGIGLGVLATSLTQKRYSSTVTIEVQKEGGNSLSLEDFSGISAQLGGGDQLSVDLLTQQTVIGNEGVALKVLEDLSLADHEPFSSIPRKAGEAAPLEDDPAFREAAVRLFESRLKVSLVKGTRLVEVTYTDQDPRQAALVANAVVAAYVVQATQQRYDATSRTSSWLANQLSDLKARVAKSQREVSEFRQKAGLLGASPVAGGARAGAGALEYDTVELGRLADLNRELTGAQVARISAEAVYRLTEGQNPDVLLGLESSQLATGANGSSLFTTASQDISTLKQLRAQEGQLKVELATESTKYGGKNPIIVDLHTQLAELDRQMGDEMRRITLQAKNAFEVASSTEASIQRSVDLEKEKIAQLNSSADQLLLLQQEEASNRSLYQDLYSRLEAANVIAGVKSSNITIVDPARVPAEPSRPQPLQNLVLGFVFGFVIGLFAVFASNHRNDALSTPDDILSQVGQPLVGIVPLFSRRQKAKMAAVPQVVNAGPAGTGKSAAWVLRAPRSATAEAYRQIRTAILLSRPGQPPKTILISSALSGDGKTTSCYNTGYAFALQGSRVLLIDADLRKPSLHAMLGLRNDRGLSQCLSSDLDPSAVIRQQGDLETLSVMTAGPIPPTPSELLGSQKFAQILARLRDEYDFIFIDAPPILMVTDAVLIAQLVDGVVLVARAGVTRRTFLLRVLDLMAGSRRKVLGVILNAADMRSAEYRSAYGYYGDTQYYRNDDEE
jgi:capsular exopolysaccharide synthesis family protein